MQSREHTGSANYTQRSSAKAALFDYENSRNPSLVIEGLSADIGVKVNSLAGVVRGFRLRTH